MAASCGCGGRPHGGCSDGKSPIEADTTPESPSSTAVPTATVTPTMVPPTATPAPDASIEVIWFNADAETRELRVLALIRNSSSQTIEGLQTRWDSFDAGGAIIESFPATLSTTPPGDSYYMGMTLNFSRVPASVEMMVTEPGQLTSGSSPLLSVGEVMFQPTM